MIRTVSFDEISDGKRYSSGDLARTDCGGCHGCSECCRKMGNSVVLDPLDSYHLTEGLLAGFDDLLQDKIELHVVDGVILPNLKMAGEEEACVFLGADGRCSIYPFRPGNCRMFPLGRIYEDRSFSYFLQAGACRVKRRAKIKVKKWIDMPDFEAYERFAADWHYFLRDAGRVLLGADEEQARTVNLYILQAFYREPYEKRAGFYPQFYRRLDRAKALLGL